MITMAIREVRSVELNVWCLTPNVTDEEHAAGLARATAVLDQAAVICASEQ